MTSYAYDSADELTQETGGVNSIVYQYDGNGNRVRKTLGGSASTYTYDSNNRLIGFASAGSSASYVMDALGRRASKMLNGSTTKFFYDRLDAVAEYDGSGVLQDLLAGHLIRLRRIRLTDQVTIERHISPSLRTGLR